MGVKAPPSTVTLSVLWSRTLSLGPGRWALGVGVPMVGDCNWTSRASNGMHSSVPSLELNCAEPTFPPLQPLHWAHLCSVRPEAVALLCRRWGYWVPHLCWWPPKHRLP